MGYEQEQENDPISVLRLDDIDVYLRSITYEEKIMRMADRFVQRVKWLPSSHRFEIYKESVHFFQELRKAEVTRQSEHIEEIHAYGEKLIDARGTGL